MTTTMNSTPAPERRIAHTRTRPTTIGLAGRSLRNLQRVPSAFLPSVLMPIVQVVAFSGTFFALTLLPGFPTDRSVNWFLPLATLMGAGFAGISTGFAAITDLESGFHDRLRMSPAPRRALVLGPLASALLASFAVTTIVLVVGAALGARLTHGPLGVVPLYVAALGVTTIGAGWGLGLAYRFGDMRASALMQLTFFVALFTTDAQTPTSVMDGWLETVTGINPFTYVLRLARLGLLDDDITANAIWRGVAALAVLGLGCLWFAARGLTRLSDH